MILKYLHIVFILLAIHASASPPEPWTATIAFPQAEVLSENTVRIPFRLADHLILLEGNINGHYGNLILDTGSKNLVINKQHFTKRRSGIRQGVGYSVNGNMGNILGQRIQHLAFSTFEIPHGVADLIDLSHIEKNKKQKILGILGQEVLHDFEVYIDFYLKQVTLFRTNNEGDRIDNHLFVDTPVAQIPFTRRSHSIIITTEIENTPLDMVLDTGAEINFLDAGISEEALSGFRAIKPVTVKGMGRKNREMMAGKLYNLRLPGNHPVGVMRTLLADLSKMTEAYGTSVDGVLGYDFIAMKRILINYKKKAIIFVKLPFNSNKS